MWLSRLILDPRSRAVQRDLADCQQMHRTVLSAFPAVATATGAPRQELGVLYRLETERSGRLLVLVQSRVEPDWSRLPRGYLLDTQGQPPNPACKPVGERYARLRLGMILAFRLRANPTRKIDTKSKAGVRRHGRRVEARNEGAQLAWLQRKAAQAGFEVLSIQARPDVQAVQARPESKVTGFRSQPDAPARHRLTFASVVFDGVLRIADADRFRFALEHGVGPGKSYGFGLLSLAPVRGTSR